MRWEVTKTCTSLINSTAMRISCLTCTSKSMRLMCWLLCQQQRRCTLNHTWRKTPTTHRLTIPPMPATSLESLTVHRFLMTAMLEEHRRMGRYNLSPETDDHCKIMDMKQWFVLYGCGPSTDYKHGLFCIVGGQEWIVLGFFRYFLHSGPNVDCFID